MLDLSKSMVDSAGFGSWSDFFDDAQDPYNGAAKERNREQKFKEELKEDAKVAVKTAAMAVL